MGYTRRYAQRMDLAKATPQPSLGDWAPDGPSAKTRAAIGQTLMYARKMDLTRMTPTDNATICSPRYCLQNPGVEYLVYQPQDGAVVLDLPAATWQVGWFDPDTGTAVEGEPVKAAGQTTFAPPFAGDAVLYVKAR